MACGEAIVWPALRVQASSFYKLVRAVVSWPARLRSAEQRGLEILAERNKRSGSRGGQDQLCSMPARGCFGQLCYCQL